MVRVMGAMSQKKVETVLLARGPEDFLDKAKEAGATVYPVRFGMDYAPWAVFKAVRMLRRLQPDVIITNISKEVRTYGVAARFLDIPVVARLGLAGDLPDNRRIRFDYRQLVRAAIVPSQSIKDGIPPHLLTPDKIRVIHNGIALSDKTASPGSTGVPVRLVYAGKISERKGVSFLCRAVRCLLEKGEALEFDLAGEGELLASLRTEYASFPGIRFHGHVSDLTYLLTHSHIGVMHSSYEGFPNTLLEYMAAGLAVITTPVDGIPEMIRPEQEGLFTPYGDEEAIFATLSRLIRAPEERLRLGRAARMRIETDFEISRQTDKIISYLKEVIAA